MQANGIAMAVLGCIGLAIMSSVANADVAPPDGYVEQCTIEKACPSGKQCLECPGNFEDYSNPPLCEKTYSAQGYTKACQSWGGSVWTEIWCRPVSGLQSTDSGDLPMDAGEAVQVVRCPITAAGASTSGSKSNSSCSVASGRAGNGRTIGLGLLGFVILFIAIRARRLR
jgi:hypothetical protein